jgi:hypothetical protein
MMNEAINTNLAINPNETIDESELVVVSREATLARHLLVIRNEFQSNLSVRGILDMFIARNEKIDKIKEAIGFNPVESDLFDEAIGILIDELPTLLQGPSSQYLIDSGTGAIIKRLEAGDIFTPPDYVGEDGLVHQSMPKVHPKICISLATAKAQKHRQQEIQTLVAKPKLEMTFKHIREPESIVEMAVSLLQARGVQVEETKDNKLVVTFGREHVDGQFQSINPTFHRWKSHASIVASKILKLVSQDCKVWIENLKEHKSSKSIFYTIDLYYQKINLLQ